MNYFFWFAACLYKYLFLLLISSVMFDSLLPHGLQHTRLHVLHCLLELAQTHVHWVGDAIQQSHPLSSPSSTSVFPRISVFSNDLALRIRGQNYWSFSYSISPFNEYQDWFPLGLTGFSPRDSQESSSTPQFKSSILQHSAFFMVQLSHPYMTTEKTIALTRWTFVDKVMSLLFNMLSRLVIREGDEFVSHRYVWEGGSCLGMHVHPWWIHVNVWQNQYSIVK